MDAVSNYSRSLFRDDGGDEVTAKPVVLLATVHFGSFPCFLSSRVEGWKDVDMTLAC